MTISLTKLPKGVSALVHHVELNKAGWWNKTLNQLVLAAVWIFEGNPDEEEIRDTLMDSFELKIGPNKLRKILSRLEEERVLIRTPKNRFRIPDEKRISMEDDIEETESIERSVCDFFNSLIARHCSALIREDVWTEFRNDALFPMIKDIGASTYRLITGEIKEMHDNYLEKFISRFDPENHDGLRKLAVSFMSEQNDSVRRYLTRMLHAQFCVESSGLPDEVIKKFKTVTGKPASFRLFVDTNFLFSLMNLHDNPSNLSADDLKELLLTLDKNPSVSLHIIPNTINEAKEALSAAKFEAEYIPISDNFTGVSIQYHPSSMIRKFLTERKKRQGALTASDWFNPYINDFVTMAKEAGINLFMEKMDDYGTRQDVIDDINHTLEHEKNTRGDKKVKRYEAVAHDVILWHLVKDKRPHYVESPVEARDWILTVDFRFIGFDKHKSRLSGTNIPLCLHPTSLIQLLQFWVPRSEAFEEAVFDVMRLPFLFQEFDFQDNKVTADIITKLGRFEGSEKVSEDTLIKIITNKELRSRISHEQSGIENSEDEKIKLIRDAFIKQLKLDTDVEKAKIRSLEERLNESVAALQNSSERDEKKDREIEGMKRQIEEQRKLMRENEREIAEMKERLNISQQRKSSWKYLLILVCTLAVSLSTGWYSKLLLAESIKDISILNTISIVLGVFVFVIFQLVIELCISNINALRGLREVSLLRRIVNFLGKGFSPKWLVFCGFILKIISHVSKSE